MINDLFIYLKPLLLTILFEGIVAYLLGFRNKKSQLLIMLVNIITNPILVTISLFLMYYLDIDKALWIIYGILEPIVIYVEYLLFKKYLNEKYNYILLSFVLNVSSIIGGLICQRIF